jgi:glutamate/tyrosine decarboxylase-like PLP-dependent enzyme
MPLHPARPRASDDEYLEVRPEYASDLATRALPRLRLPEEATAPRVAYDVSEAVRKRGWIVPAYRMPTGLEDVHVLHVVVRNGFGRDLARMFMDDLGHAVEHLEATGGHVAPGDRAGFHH